jgi:hypothetical protein
MSATLMWNRAAPGQPGGQGAAVCQGVDQGGQGLAAVPVGFVAHLQDGRFADGALGCGDDGLAGGEYAGAPVRERFQLGGRVAGRGDAIPPLGCAGVGFQPFQQGPQDRCLSAERGVDGLVGYAGIEDDWKRMAGRRAR